MISSSQFFLPTTPPKARTRSEWVRSLCCLTLVTTIILLGTSSTRPRLPKTLVLPSIEYSSLEALESMRNGGKELFTYRIETRLPKYTGLIHRAAAENGVDWRLLAAMSYQESFWNPDATSSTGVQGLMMLTQVTADELNVEDRLDPKQSILGGATYFAKLRSRLPESIHEPDRTSMALAAYNMGMSHLEDARVLTEYYGKDPNCWNEVAAFIPLLEDKEYYSALKNGFARGSEATRYVQRIREYQAVIAWHSQTAIALSSNDPRMTPTSALQPRNWPKPSAL